MKFTIRTPCGECGQSRRFELVSNGQYSWYQCPTCGESFGLEVSTALRVKRAGRIT
jgi:uncharacterized Zn finger protein